MKFFALLLSVAYLAACCSAAGDENDAKEHDKISMVPIAAEKPTTPHFVNPTKASNVQVSATQHVRLTNNMEKALPIEMPATVEHSLQAVESKPLAVTGFITTNGSIYEIEDKNGFGKIQSRQAVDEAQHICNYGAVVIYSDIPCHQVTNVKVRDVGEKPALSQVPTFVMHQNNQSSEDDDNSNLEDQEEEEDVETWQMPFRLRATKGKPKKKKKRPNSNTPKRPNQNGAKLPNKNGQNRPVKVQVTRPNKNAQKKPNKNNLNRPNKNGQKRPNKIVITKPNLSTQLRPNKNGPKRPSKGVQKRPNKTGQKRPNKGGQKRPNNDVEKLPLSTNNKNFRRWEEEDEVYDDDYDDYDRYLVNQRYQEVEPYSFEYEYY